MSVFPVSLKTPDFRRADRIRGLIIVGATFVLCLLISVWAKRRAKPEVSRPPAPPTSVGVVGFPKAVDPLKTLPAARALTPRNLLRGITADRVDRQGNVDVSAGGRVVYVFQSAAGQGPQPAREPGTLARRPYCGRQNIAIGKEGMVAEPDSAEASCSPQPADPLPEPRCTLADLWAYASAHSAAAGHAAHIEYYRSKAGPAWRFDSVAGGYRFSLYGDCKRELDPRDAMSVAP
ncbi:MAG TPA: hypothetical protein VGM44_04430 [Polyangiaceae bacterium]